MLEYQKMNDQGEIVTFNKIDIAIERLKAFEPEEGYYLAFSGGKDSQCIYHLAKEAEVKFDAHYNITGVDPPELVYFIREQYPDVHQDMYKKSMWKLIEENGIPTRLCRFCCRGLKERGGEGRICVTGVRWQESYSRSQRKPLEIIGKTKKDSILFNDNTEARRLFETCTVKGKRLVNPIIDWEDSDVWEYIHARELKYCRLYDEGWTRIGCIGCPMGRKSRLRDFAHYPKIEQAYRRAFARNWAKRLERCKQRNETPPFANIDELWNWWMSDEPAKDENQLAIEFEGEEEDQ